MNFFNLMPPHLSIISVSQDKTNVYRSLFSNPVISLHEQTTFLDLVVKFANQLPWEGVVARARKEYLFGNPDIGITQFPPKGVFLMTPDLFTDQICIAREWHSRSPNDRVLISYEPNTHDNDFYKLRDMTVHFSSIIDELDFLERSSWTRFTKNSALKNHINWRVGKFQRLAEWNIPETVLYSRKVSEMGWLEKLEHFTPSSIDSEDLVYRIMKDCQAVESKYFVSVLNCILEALRNSEQPSYYELLVRNDPVILCGFDEGAWPIFDSQEGDLLKALLLKSNTLTTRALRGYGPCKLHSWALGRKVLDGSDPLIRRRLLSQMEPQLKEESVFVKPECKYSKSSFLKLNQETESQGIISRSRSTNKTQESNQEKISEEAELQSARNQFKEINCKIPLELPRKTTLRHVANFIYSPEKFTQQVTLRVFNEQNAHHKYLSCALHDLDVSGISLSYEERLKAMGVLSTIKGALKELELRLQPLCTHLKSKWAYYALGYEFQFRVDRIYECVDKVVLVCYHLAGYDLAPWIACIWPESIGLEVPKKNYTVYSCGIQGCVPVKPRDFLSYLSKVSKSES